jgi:hypothetical protein
MTLIIWSSRQTSTATRPVTGSASWWTGSTPPSPARAWLTATSRTLPTTTGVEIPAAGTATGRRLFIVVSNFGGLAAIVADNSWRQTQEEFTKQLHPDDAQRVHTALDDLGYTVVPEGLLRGEDYDGDAFRSDPWIQYRPTWWDRFFGYV